MPGGKPLEREQQLTQITALISVYYLDGFLVCLLWRHRHSSAPKIISPISTFSCCLNPYICFTVTLSEHMSAVSHVWDKCSTTLIHRVQRSVPAIKQQLGNWKRSQSLTQWHSPRQLFTAAGERQAPQVMTMNLQHLQMGFLLNEHIWFACCRAQPSSSSLKAFRFRLSNDHVYH